MSDVWQVRQPGGPAVPVISCAPVVSIFLRLLLGCEDATERLHTLEALHHLCGAQNTPISTLVQALALVLCRWC